MDKHTPTHHPLLLPCGGVSSSGVHCRTNTLQQQHDTHTWGVVGGHHGRCSCVCVMIVALVLLFMVVL